MIIIGEKINGSIPSVAKAIAERDSEFIKERARKQAAANATYIDCCASVPEAEEVETLKWMIDCIQEVTDLPISVDSPSADVLTQAYKFCKRPGIFNSVSGEGDKIDKIFPLMAQEENKDWQVIALLSDDTGIPKCAADRLRVFDKIMAKAKEYGISPSRIHIDSAIMDPTNRDMLGLTYATEALLGEDEFCMEYIGAYREGLIGPLPKA